MKLQKSMQVFEQYESEVRAYSRSFPTVFHKAKGAKMWDIEGKEYIDFLSGAGALNYGHNDPKMKEQLIQYIEEDGMIHSLDISTTAKENFISTFQEVILQPRGLDYKIMFPGPTGTNTVESALKLARKVTGRSNIISFTNGFHGMTLGSLAVTGNAMKREGAGVPLSNTTHMPFDQYYGPEVDTIQYLERYLEDQGSGVDLPAAVIVETVQGEGGINVASFEWLQRLEAVCQRWNLLLIVDDVQAGVGRTGTFFSFEPAGIKPDIVCLSKSISGYGLPLAITLFKPEYDIWKPGEHNGTFRGNNPAFVTATASLRYWQDGKLEQEIATKAKEIQDFLEQLVQTYPEIKGKTRGRGLMQGVACDVEGVASTICAEAFQRGLIMETSGANDEVFKLFPACTISNEDLHQGLSIIEQSVQSVVESSKKPTTV